MDHPLLPDRELDLDPVDDLDLDRELDREDRDLDDEDEDRDRRLPNRGAGSRLAACRLPHSCLALETMVPSFFLCKSCLVTWPPGVLSTAPLYTKWYMSFRARDTLSGCTSLQYFQACVGFAKSLGCTWGRTRMVPLPCTTPSLIIGPADDESGDL
jgi:hypothetical protein